MKRLSRHNPCPPFNPWLYRRTHAISKEYSLEFRGLSSKQDHYLFGTRRECRKLARFLNRYYRRHGYM